MAILRPQNEADIVDAVQAARASGRTLEILGRGSKRGLGYSAIADDMLDCSALSGILSYEPDELVLSARAATPLAEISAAIAERNQCLGFDPPDWGPLWGGASGEGTIGGAVAADLSGSMRLRYGGARDHLLGFRAVNGHGEAYKGGSRVVKNVTGFDISKLMCGSFGMFGPLCEVTLKLTPRGPRSITLAVRDLPPEEGLLLLRHLQRQPLEASGLLYLPPPMLESFCLPGGAGAAVLRLDGAPQALADKRNLLNSLLEGRAAIEVPQGDGLFTLAACGSAFEPTLDLWRMSVPPSASIETASALSGTLWYADWAGALFWIGAEGKTAAAGLHRIAMRAGGQLQWMRGAPPADGAPLTPPGDGQRRMLQAVKQAFDPLEIFNPGRIYQGL